MTDTGGIAMNRGDFLKQTVFSAERRLLPHQVEHAILRGSIASVRSMPARQAAANSWSPWQRAASSRPKPAAP